MFSGSIGKTYVAAVMLQLVAEGRAGLDDPVSRWLGGETWFGRLPNASALTLRMLLAHTSGIPEHIQVTAFQDALAADPFKVWKPAEMVAYVLDTKPLFPAGSSFSYADTNYILVGMIIERITGLTYYGVLDERILRPLALRDTTPSDRPDLPGLVCGHTTPDNPFRVPDRTLVDGRYPMNPQVEWTGGGLISTSADLARWAAALYAGDVLPPAAREQMLQTGPSNLGEGVRYGLGAITWDRPPRTGLGAHRLGPGLPLRDGLLPVPAPGGRMPGQQRRQALRRHHASVPRRRRRRGDADNARAGKQVDTGSYRRSERVRRTAATSSTVVDIAASSGFGRSRLPPRGGSPVSGAGHGTLEVRRRAAGHAMRGHRAESSRDAAGCVTESRKGRTFGPLTPFRP